MFEIATKPPAQRPQSSLRAQALGHVAPHRDLSAEIWVALPNALGFLDPQSGKYGIFQRALGPTTGTHAAPKVPEDLLKEFRLKPESLAAFTHAEMGTVLVDMETSRVFQFDSAGTLRCRHLPAALGPFVCTLPAKIRVEIVTPNEDGGQTVHTHEISPADVVREAASRGTKPSVSEPIEGSQRTAALTLILMAAGFAGIYALTHQYSSRVSRPAPTPQVTSPQATPEQEPPKVPPVEEAAPPAAETEQPTSIPSDSRAQNDAAPVEQAAPTTSPAPAPEAPTDDAAASVPSAIDPVDPSTPVAQDNSASNIPAVPTPSGTTAPVTTAPENQTPVVTTLSPSAPIEVGAEVRGTDSPSKRPTLEPAPVPDSGAEAAPASRADQQPAQPEHPGTNKPAPETQIPLTKTLVQREPHGLSVPISDELLSILGDRNVTEGSNGEEHSAHGTLVTPEDARSLSVLLSEESLHWLYSTDYQPPASPGQVMSPDRTGIQSDTKPGAQSGASSLGVPLPDWSRAVLEGKTLP